MLESIVSYILSNKFLIEKGIKMLLILFFIIMIFIYKLFLLIEKIDNIKTYGFDVNKKRRKTNG